MSWLNTRVSENFTTPDQGVEMWNASEPELQFASMSMDK